MTTELDRAASIAALNDAFRAAGPERDWVMTAGVQSRGLAFIAAVIAKVRTHACFPPDSNPHGERDFGVITLAGERVWFKIDYYDLDLRYGWEDPADPAQTRRVLTIMFPNEY